jgi:RNA polymerase subunit RPABC4/transcription elongation factor Spt4
MQTCPEETRRENIYYPGSCIVLSVVAEWAGMQFIMSPTIVAITKTIQIESRLG